MLFIDVCGCNIGQRAPAGIHLLALACLAVALPHFAFALAVALTPALAFAASSVLVLGPPEILLLSAASLLQLDVDGVGFDLQARHRVDPHLVASHLGPEREEEAPQLLLESLVEVEVDEGVVDVGAFGEQGGEDKALGRHEAGLLVENEEEGDDGVRGPSDDEAHADAEKHLEEEGRDERSYLNNDRRCVLSSPNSQMPVFKYKSVTVFLLITLKTIRKHYEKKL